MDCFGTYFTHVQTCFFCWRLLGLIPGGAPFSQLSRGVKDAMVVSTKLVKCHFDKNMQKRPIETTLRRVWNKKPSTESARTAKEGSGDVRKTTPMPERLQQHRKKMALVKPTGSTYARASVQVTRKWRIWRRSFYCWPLIKYFVWNTILWELMCEVNPQAMASHWQKWWNIGETWNCTHLRFRSVYLGLAKQRQRRKRK